MISTRLDSLEKDVKAFGDRFDYMQTTVRDIKKDSIASTSRLEELQEKLWLYEDKSRQNNLGCKGTSQKRKAMSERRKRLQQLGIESYLLYPAVVKVINHEQILFKTPGDIEKFVSSLDADARMESTPVT
ncbi:hypothetical protein ROHU_009878 [Labeo rohita]|uniref:LINE-1 type transposase domain-containing 1 n=1 Tax=Labeo rohita TaxID=84645 RepID=A0A498LB18_LABRO|nr:hypothetical protein ROHU_033394 [Labeo rohita]RXN13056.1 hypothetical protein ROHU_009878 [Labeo rohita]